MSSRHLASNDDGERGRAVERLRAAVAERRDAHTRRAREGSKDEEAASVAAHAVDGQAVAPAPHLKSVTDTPSE